MILSPRTAIRSLAGASLSVLLLFPCLAVAGPIPRPEVPSAEVLRKLEAKEQAK